MVRKDRKFKCNNIFVCQFPNAGKTIGIVHTADHRGRIDCIGPDYAGNASFTLRPTTIIADLSAGQMAALIDGDMKRMLAPECERRYFVLYHAMLERKMPYMFISPEFSHVAKCRENGYYRNQKGPR